MLELAVQASQQKSFFSRTRGSSFHIRLVTSEETSEIPVSRFTETLLDRAPEILPSVAEAEIREENGNTVFLVHNIRGRPGESFPFSNPPQPPRFGEPRREEFFHSNGSLFVLPEQLRTFPNTVQELDKIPFTYRLHSRFDSFDAQNGIVHRLEHEAHQIDAGLFSDLNLKRMTRIAPLELDQVRLGFESYRPQFLGAILGRIPQVEKRLFLEVRSDRIYLFIEELQLPDAQTLPFETAGSLGTIASLLEELGLYSGLEQRLRDASDQPR
jgi:hypothetical protein